MLIIIRFYVAEWNIIVTIFFYIMDRITTEIWKEIENIPKTFLGSNLYWYKKCIDILDNPSEKNNRIMELIYNIYINTKHSDVDHLKMLLLSDTKKCKKCNLVYEKCNIMDKGCLKCNPNETICIFRKDKFPLWIH